MLLFSSPSKLTLCLCIIFSVVVGVVVCVLVCVVGCASDFLEDARVIQLLTKMFEGLRGRVHFSIAHGVLRLEDGVVFAVVLVFGGLFLSGKGGDGIVADVVVLPDSVDSLCDAGVNFGLAFGEHVGDEGLDVVVAVGGLVVEEVGLLGEGGVLLVEEREDGGELGGLGTFLGVLGVSGLLEHVVGDEVVDVEGVGVLLLRLGSGPGGVVLLIVR